MAKLARLTKLTRLLSIGFIVASPITGFSAAEQDYAGTHRIEALAYGQALFEYFQGDTMAALLPLDVAVLRGHIAAITATDQVVLNHYYPLLFRAGLYFDYGLPEAAARQFTALEQHFQGTNLAEIPAMYHWQYLQGKQAFERGDWQASRKLLEPLPARLYGDEVTHLLQAITLQLESTLIATPAAREWKSQSSPASIWSLYTQVQRLQRMQTVPVKAWQTLLAEIKAFDGPERELTSLTNFVALAAAKRFGADSNASLRSDGQSLLESIPADSMWQPFAAKQLAIIGSQPLAPLQQQLRLAQWSGGLSASDTLAGYQQVLAVATAQLNDFAMIESDSKFASWFSAWIENALSAQLTALPVASLYWQAWLADSDQALLLERLRQLQDLQSNLSIIGERLPYTELLFKKAAEDYRKKLSQVSQDQWQQEFIHLSAEFEDLQARLEHALAAPNEFGLASTKLRDFADVIKTNQVRVQRLGERLKPSQRERAQRILTVANGRLLWLAQLEFSKQRRQAERALAELKLELNQVQSRLQRLAQAGSNWQGEQGVAQLAELAKRLSKVQAQVKLLTAQTQAVLSERLQTELIVVQQQHRHEYVQLLLGRAIAGDQLYQQQIFAESLAGTESLADSLAGTATLAGTINSTINRTSSESHLALSQLVVWYEAALSAHPPNKAPLDAHGRLAQLTMEQAVATGMGFERAAQLANSWLKRPEVIELNEPQTPHFATRATLMYQLAHAQAVLGQQQASLATMRQWLNDQPRGWAAQELWFRLGEAEFAQQAYQQAGSSFAQAVALPGKLGVDARFMQGWAQYKQGQFDVAYDLFEQVYSQVDATQSKSQFQAPGKLQSEVQRVLLLTLAQLGGTTALTQRYPEQLPAQGLAVVKLLLKQQLLERQYYEYHQTQQWFATHYKTHADAVQLALEDIAVLEQHQFFEAARAAKARFINNYDTTASAASAGFALDLARYDGANGRSQAQLNQAVQWYQTALDLDLDKEERAPVLLALAELHLQLKQSAQSFAVFLAASQQAGESALGLQAGQGALAAIAQLDKPDADQRQLALELTQRLVREFPNEPAVQPLRIELAQGELAQKQWQKARDLVAPLLVQAVGFAEPNSNAPAPNRPSKRSASNTAQLEREAIEITTASYYNQALWPEAIKSFEQALVWAAQDNHKQLPTRWRLALAQSYRQQADAQLMSEDLAGARETLLRLSKRLPQSALVPGALFDAGELAAQQQQYPAAIANWSQLVKDYPQTEFSAKALLKLARSHQQLEQPLEAASWLQQALAASKDGKGPIPAQQRAALTFETAQLWQQAGKPAFAKALLQHLLATEPVQSELWSQTATALVALSSTNATSTLALQNQITTTLAPHFEGLSPVGQSLMIASSVAVAEQAQSQFVTIKLSNPLPVSLQQKQASLLEATERFEAILALEISPAYEQALYGLGQLKLEFAKALMDSERPSGLSELALEEYDMLLEEQAFPFEEQGLAYHKLNLERLWSGTNNQYSRDSLKQLQAYLPGQYQRDELVEGFE